MKKLLFLLIILSLTHNSYCTETISQFDDNGLVILNEELRSLSNDITDSKYKVKMNATDTADYLGSQVSGSIIGTGDTLMLSGDTLTPGSSKVYGTDSAGLKGWKNDPTFSDINTSNVVFSFTGCVDYGNYYGYWANASEPGTTTAGLGSGWFVSGQSEQVIIRTKFKKIAGISTVTFFAYVRTNQDSTGDSTNVKVTINASAATATNVGPFNTLQWISASIDVSGLTNGTTYDVTVSMWATNVNTVAKMYSIIGIAS